MNGVQGFTGSLIGLSGERIQIMDYVTLETTYGEEADTKTINIGYLVMNIMLPHNIILGCLTINALGEFVST